MRVLRAHSYKQVEGVRAQLRLIPDEVMVLCKDIGFYLLPDDLSPLYTGLLQQDRLISGDIGGRMLSECGGWFLAHNKEQHPYIYLNEDTTWAAIHEIGHAIDWLLGYPSEALYKPECAMYDYMAQDADEYFACAFHAWVLPRDNDFGFIHREHLAQWDINIFKYFEQLQRELK